MKKRVLALLCTIALSVCGLTLVACGDSGDASKASKPDTTKFVGEWKIAAFESEGITMVGDMSAFMGESTSIALTINEDGAGSMSYGEDTADFSWVANDDASKITITVAESDADGAVSDLENMLGGGTTEGEEATEKSTEPITFDITYNDADKALVLTNESDGQEFSAYFTADGTLSSMPVINADATQPITDKKQLIGDWKLTGISMMGISMYGTQESLATMAGDTDMSFSLAEDGTGTMADESISWKIGDDGATMTAEGQDIKVSALGDGIALDFAETYGIEMILVYGK